MQDPLMRGSQQPIISQLKFQNIKHGYSLLQALVKFNQRVPQKLFFFLYFFRHLTLQGPPFFPRMKNKNLSTNSNQYMEFSNCCIESRWCKLLYFFRDNQRAKEANILINRPPRQQNIVPFIEKKLKFLLISKILVTIRERLGRVESSICGAFVDNLPCSARSNKRINCAEAKQITSMLRLQVNCTIQSII